MDTHHTYLERRINQTGWFAKQFLKLKIGLNKVEKGYRYTGKDPLKHSYYWTLHKINTHKVLKAIFTFIYVYNFIGTLTGKDQEIFSSLSEGKYTPRSITIINSVVFGFIMTLYYYSIVILINFISGKAGSFSDAFLTLSTALKIILLAELIWDVYRIAYAIATKKGREPIGLMPFLLNAPTYIKRIKQH
ncbi:MAG: hypothetical protein ABIJ21_04285 [Nanoarchaeota archaeon]